MIVVHSKKILDNIFDYDDYRLFLKDYFRVKLQENSHFSQRYFAGKAGFNSHNFCSLVISGKRNLSTDSMRKIAKALELKAAASNYFENLVSLNQATSPSDKEYYFQQIKKVRGKHVFVNELKKEQFFFYEKWYYPVISELMVLAKWNDDYSLLAKMVRPAIKVSEAKKAVILLLESGIVCREGKGRYVLMRDFITSENVPALIKKQARRDVLLKGIEIIDTVAPGEKYSAYSTVIMSKELYKKAREIFDDARERILALAADDTGAEEVYEVVLQVFPVSNVNGNRITFEEAGR
jgi:uncharacterized protein (TIGR02147 family)